MVQTGTPTSTNTNDWTVTDAGSAHEALASNDDTSLVETATETDICNCSIGTLTDPAVSTGHIIRVRGQATGSGGPEKIIIKVYNGTTERAASGKINVTRSSFNDFSYTLSAGEADALDSYSNLRVEVIADTLGAELLEISYLALEIPDASGDEDFILVDNFSGSDVLITDKDIIHTGTLSGTDTLQTSKSILMSDAYNNSDSLITEKNIFLTDSFA